MTDEQITRTLREAQARAKAIDTGKPVSYIDDDGAEVVALPSGEVFYNAAEWF